MNVEFSTDVPPEQMEITLGALQFSYQRLIKDCEYFTDYLRQQLSHVESLQSHPTSVITESPFPSDSPAQKEVPLASTRRGKIRGKSAPVPARQKKRNTTLKVVKFYERFTMHEAISYLLNQNIGRSLDADTIVSELYGNLDEDGFRVAKDRVTKSLSKGKQEGKWYRVPDQLGAYTASLER